MKELDGQTFYLEEEKRPGEFYEVQEDQNGTYFMNSKDNCLLPYLKDMAEAGICSFKVEGRNKTEYYLSTVAKAYRKAVDDMMEGKPFDASLMDEVAKTASRGFIPGYLFGFPGDYQDTYFADTAPIQTHKFVGMVMGREKAGLGRDDLYEVDVKNKLLKGELVEVMTPDDQFSLKIEEMFDLEGKEVESIHGGAGMRLLKLKAGIPEGAMLRIESE